MANQEYVNIFLQGAEAWKKWRQANLIRFTWKDPPSTWEDDDGSGHQSYQFYRADFTKVDFSGQNLEGRDLSKIDFSGANLRNTILKGVNLYGAILDDAILEAANLEKAQLKEINFNRAKLSNAELSGASISNGNFRQTILTQTDFSKSDMERLNFRGADLREAIFREAKVDGCDFRGANLSGADLSYAHLYPQAGGPYKLDFRGANLSGASFKGVMSQRHQSSRLETSEDRWDKARDTLNVDLQGANLSKADLSHLDITGQELSNTVLAQANLNGSTLRVANLQDADLSHANLCGANLEKADLTRANLSEADLSRANLNSSILIETTLIRANLTECSIYGISAWNVHLDEAIQKSLIITTSSEPTITVDNLKVAQFIYLLLYNKEIREVVDTITSKVVLILGRFTPARKVVLDAIKAELRKRDYSPVLFDFEKPTNRDITETISTLAHLARFVIADITDPKSIPQELAIIVPHLPSVPVQPLLQASEREYGMFEHFRKYHWVLPEYRYKDLDSLLLSLAESVIAPAERKAKEQQKT